jgi:hypothetical protein
MKLLKNIARSFAEIFAEKKSKFVNASQQAQFADVRAAALKNLMDPKAKLSGAQRRRLLEQTGRPLDPSEGYVYTAPKSIADKWFNRLMSQPLARLVRFSRRAGHRLSGVQRTYDKATTSRNRRLLQPKLDYCAAIAKTSSEVLLFRTNAHKL